MNEMIERVARAIAAEHFKRKQWVGMGTKEAWAALRANDYWRNFESAARAAIAAMREPSDTMMKAAWEEGTKVSSEFSAAPGDAHWRAMIDAALST